MHNGNVSHISAGSKLRIGLCNQPLSADPSNVHYRELLIDQITHIHAHANTQPCYQHRFVFVTHLFVGQLFTAPLLANLVAFVVSTGRTVAAIVLLLAANAFAAAFALLFLLARKQKQVTVRSVWERRHKREQLLVNLNPTSQHHAPSLTCLSLSVSSHMLIEFIGLLKSLAVLEIADTCPGLPLPMSIALLSDSALDSSELARFFRRSFLRASICRMGVTAFSTLISKPLVIIGLA